MWATCHLPRPALPPAPAVPCRPCRQSPPPPQTAQLPLAVCDAPRECLRCIMVSRNIRFDGGESWPKPPTTSAPTAEVNWPLSASRECCIASFANPTLPPRRSRRSMPNGRQRPMSGPQRSKANNLSPRRSRCLPPRHPRASQRAFTCIAPRLPTPCRPIWKTRAGTTPTWKT